MKQNKRYIDLHVHSYYSDGTMSPREILDEAQKQGVNFLAVADHNQLEGTRELLDLASDYAVEVISGVEIDALDHDLDVHILAYGFDLTDKVFSEFIQINRHHLDETSRMLIEKMASDINQVGFTVDAYERFEHPRDRGGWKALHFLKKFGHIEHLMDGLAYYEKYDCSYDKVGFESVESVCNRIHAAGGFAILAHPGVTFKKHPLMPKLEQMRSCGIDGIECYYPKHDELTTRVCIQFCHDYNLMITSGSDCHGSFGNTVIGQMKINDAFMQKGVLKNWG